jgi:hypothetical protein|tara:strand:+ start:386 stop:691 length:306 start_codon:yes stop_codon:yes gene_type:complete
MKTKSFKLKQILNKEKSINFFIRYGYFIHRESDEKLILRKTGTQFTTSGEKFPKELSISFQNNETAVSLKYDGFVLFDTGDLQEELNLISSRVKTNIHNLV